MSSVFEEINDTPPKMSTNILETIEDKTHDNIQDEIQKTKNFIIEEVDLGNIKKRSRKIIPDNKRCMGRKIDSLRCTRSRILGSEFCRSHLKSLPNGRIDDGKIIKPKSAKRGRKKKYENNDDYISVHRKSVDGESYFIDSFNYMYTNNLNEPERIGVYDKEDDVIIPLKKSDIIKTH